MTTARQRIDALVAMKDTLIPWIGDFDAAALENLLEAQLGSSLALDEWIPRGDTRSRATALSPLLHIVSGNTPHAAFQSAIRGLLVGSHNQIKLPRTGIPEFEEWIASLPHELASLIETHRDLPPDGLEHEAIVIFGNAATIETFRRLVPAGTPRIEHGPKLSIAVIFTPDTEAADLAAQDILAFDQLGCLSVQAVYVAGGPLAARAFAAELAGAMARHRQATPRGEITLSEAGAISNAREIVRFRSANGDDTALWESHGDTSWTVVYETNPTLAPGPLNGYATVHPLPAAGQLRIALGQEAIYLSTVALHPFNDALADRLELLNAPRTCALGRSQHPPLFWHHDGRPPLADLVRWRDRA